MNIKVTNALKKEPLRIIKKLPQIIIPSNKVDMFTEWYNSDLRFQDEIPRAFNNGYVFIEFDHTSNIFLSLDNHELIKSIAKTYKKTYREIENLLKNFLDTTKNAVVYFEFQDDFLTIRIYIQDYLTNQIVLDLKQRDSSKPNPSTEEMLNQLSLDDNNTYTSYAYFCFILTECALWYLATASKRTKYYRENNAEPYYYEKREVIQTKKNRTITTPVYDMNKIRKVKVDSLIKRRKGWTYSHSFQVQGHYRHYADGKVIFINSYIKGKGKEEMAQVITLNPKELK